MSSLAFAYRGDSKWHLTLKICNLPSMWTQRGVIGEATPIYWHDCLRDSLIISNFINPAIPSHWSGDPGISGKHSQTTTLYPALRLSEGYRRDVQVQSNKSLTMK